MSFKKYLLILILITSNVFAANQTLYYQPKVVSLIGTIEMQTFPGLPGYESIKNGDEIERGPYLRLDHPIDVDIASGLKDGTNDERETNVQIVQIVDGKSSDWQMFFKKGKRVQITGELFHRLTGHHHSRVLVDVREIKFAE